MNLSNYFWYFTGVLTPKFCDEVIKYALSQEEVMARTGGYGDKKLNKDKDVFDALYSGFPAGTLTGAPKIRALEIIYKLEPTRRGVYSGAIGYFDFTGDMNTCIAIRTMVMKDKRVYFQSGAGIVYDSIPEKEFEETENKARAINSAINLAENGLVK